MSDQLYKDRTISLGGKEHTLRPSFLCIQLTEKRTGKSVFQILTDFQFGKGTFQDVVGVIHSGMVAYLRDAQTPHLAMEYSELGEMIRQEGVSKFMTEAVSLVGDMLVPDPEKKTTDPQQPTSNA